MRIRFSALGFTLMLAGCFTSTTDPSLGPGAGAYNDSVSVERLEVGADALGDGAISAVVTNRSSRDYQTVDVSFDLFEADGVRGRTTPPHTVFDLKAGQSARVHADYYQHEGIDSVAVADVRVTVKPLVAE